MDTEQAISKIKRQNKFVAIAMIVVLIGVILFLDIFHGGVRSSPELLEIKEFIAADTGIARTYGKLSSVDLNEYEYSKSLVNGSKNGCFIFKIKGEHRYGRHRICWEKIDSLKANILSQDTVSMAGISKILGDLDSLIRKK